MVRPPHILAASPVSAGCVVFLVECCQLLYELSSSKPASKTLHKLITPLDVHQYQAHQTMVEAAVRVLAAARVLAAVLKRALQIRLLTPTLRDSFHEHCHKAAYV